MRRKKALPLAVAERPVTLLAQQAPAPLAGELRPPSDKSISHRAVILAMLAEGESRIEGLLMAEDVDATARACGVLGARLRQDENATLVDGTGGRGLNAPAEPLDMGNSGTAMRLLAGVLVAQPFDTTITGDASLLRRPMERIAAPLRKMGAVIRTRPNGCAPLEIEGGRRLRGIRYHSPVASAQVKSCLLLAGLHAAGETVVIEPGASRDHTERMLPVFGVDSPPGASVRGGSRLTAAELAIPADPSSAAFMMAAACLVPESELRLRDVGLNPTRSGFLQALESMGCDVRISARGRFGGEPVGNVEVRWRAGMKGITLGGGAIPAIIDELPMLMAMAALADGETRIRDAQELRVKESDRIAVMGSGLQALGFRVRMRPDGIDIEGQPGPGRQNQASGGEESVTIDAAGDHRCAMSFCILAQALERPLRIRGAAQIDTSYPGFLADLTQLGGLAKNEQEAANHAR